MKSFLSLELLLLIFTTLLQLPATALQGDENHDNAIKELLKVSQTLKGNPKIDPKEQLELVWRFFDNDTQTNLDVQWCYALVRLTHDLDSNSFFVSLSNKASNPQYRKNPLILI